MENSLGSEHWCVDSPCLWPLGLGESGPVETHSQVLPALSAPGKASAVQRGQHTGASRHPNGAGGIGVRRRVSAPQRQREEARHNSPQAVTGRVRVGVGSVDGEIRLAGERKAAWQPGPAPES